ncbi:MAG: hypothetical protein H0T42_05555 [Deltaproteobacteria bacterium]|nr:hypothetical protein [Deltaproteobacteria bacterium]
MSDFPDFKLSATGRKVALSLVPVICPPEYVQFADAIVTNFELTISVSPLLLRKGVSAGFATYDLGALPRYRKRAHKLTGEDAERYFSSWEHGITPLHVQFARALNQLLSLGCYDVPEVMEAIGYRPAPWIEEVTRKRLTVYAADVRKQEVQILAPDPLRPGFRIEDVRRDRKVGA